MRVHYTVLAVSRHSAMQQGQLYFWFLRRSAAQMEVVGVECSEYLTPS